MALDPMAMGENDLAVTDDLASLWESDQAVRNRARSNRQVCLWSDPKVIGVASAAACALNAGPLTLCAKWWVTQQKAPGAIPIDIMRNQAATKMFCCFLLVVCS